MNTNSPVWIPARGVADQLGLHPRMFLKDCQAGRLPIRLHHVGERGRAHVLAADVQAYLRSLQQHPAEGIR